MSFDPLALLARLESLESGTGQVARYVIALSGGLDSTVLTHALATTRELHGKALLALHVDHGLQPESAEWSKHCESFAAGLGIDCECVRVTVDTDRDQGIEAAARQARYAALVDYIGPQDWLLSAHHQDDQAETLLMNLMRGSGPAGIAGIGSLNRFGAGWLARPMLDIAREALEQYAEMNGLDWVRDTSNENLRFDRNFLRHEVVPLLEQRWPGVTGRLARSAALSGEAADLLEELARLDLEATGGRCERIAVSALLALPEARQRNLLRHAIREAGLPLPPATKLSAIVEQLLPAREDAQPCVAWPGVEVRRYRDSLHILAADATQPLPDGAPLGESSLELPNRLGTLTLSPGAPYGLSDAVIEQGLTLHFRRGGEEIKVHGQRHTRKIKKLLQEEGVVPWMRDRVPLIYAGDTLVAVGDLWVAASAASEPGTAVCWHNRPALH